MTFTDRDLRMQVTHSLTGQADEYDVQAIVDEIQRKYGTVSIATIPGDDYSAILERFAL